MTRLRVACFALSIDGFGAGPEQSLAHPLGLGGEALHEWAFATRSFGRLHGDAGASGTTGVDDAFVARGFENVGAWIIGRHMFGPVRGPWPDESWQGWWGDDPPFRCPVFVLTHHARAPIELRGGTRFHFVTGGIREALDRARAAAGGLDVRLGGGVATLRRYVEADLVDEMHLAIAPVLLGRGEPLFAGLDLPRRGFRVAGRAQGEGALHVVLRRE